VIDYFAQHHDIFFYMLTAICLLAELTVLGLSGPLLFIAIGSLAAGLLTSMGLLHDFGIALVILAGFSIASAGLLWGPLKRMQNQPVTEETSSDMVGKILPVTATITLADGRVSYSGVEWLARLDSSSNDPIEAGQRAEVTSVFGTILVVKAK
jgi:membrane protein implicated in regulation of membrane protease activity